MSHSESNNSNQADEKRIERAKGIFDGAESVEDMIAQLEQKKQQLEELNKNGWELEDKVVVNDYANLVKNDE